MKVMTTLVIGFIVALVVLFSFAQLVDENPSHQDKIEERPEANVITQELTEWEIFKIALAWVESEFDSTICREDTNAGGIMQLTPIYIREVNRLEGYEKWTEEDRLDPVKSFQIFEDMMSHKNPSRDINVAIKLHNPKAGKWYCKRIVARMGQVEKYERARLSMQTAYMRDTVSN